MINVLNAIERRTAALTTRPAQHTEASFLSSYRRHVIDQPGKTTAANVLRVPYMVPYIYD
jgi:hypothetical protein